MSELRPCPMCGSPAEMHESANHDYFVKCTNKACGVATKRCNENRNGAVEIWNDRAAAWIPVDEDMPDDEVMVLVSCRAKNGIASVNRAYHMNGFWHGSGSMSGVEAWMHLPEPYEAVES